MRIILYLNLFHQLAILALVEVEGTMFLIGSLFRDWCFINARGLKFNQ
jgi:hypothetical protein